MCAAFYRYSLVNNVALNPGGRCKPYFQSTDLSYDPTIDHDIIGKHLAFDRRTFANYDSVSANIPIHDPVQVNFARSSNISRDLEIT